MTLGALLIGAAILVLAALYVINPVVDAHKKQPLKAAILDESRQHLQKDVLAAIRDLDFDYQTGKVIQEDYETSRTQLVFQAAEFIQKKKQEDEKIEAMIHTRLLSVKTPAQCDKCGGEIGPQDVFCPTCGIAVKNQAGTKKTSVHVLCPGCGNKVRAGDLYCTSCGKRVYGQAAVNHPTAEN
jgi:predicted RNA-binding Zn-ribbon protein involved in translation (DUF1610 family)